MAFVWLFLFLVVGVSGALIVVFIAQENKEFEEDVWVEEHIHEQSVAVNTAHNHALPHIKSPDSF